jgi:hypothetical protein
VDVARDMSRFFGRDMSGSVYKADPIPELAAAAQEK